MLVRVSDPDRLVDLIIFLKNSGFPLAQRQTAKLHDRDEAKMREAGSAMGGDLGRACGTACARPAAGFVLPGSAKNRLRWPPGSAAALSRGALGGIALYAPL